MWNPVIQFWHGRPLSRIERLSLASFVAQGHDVRLYSYVPLGRVPSGVQRCDAREILPAERLTYDRKNRSWAPFADVFRYEALRRLGGLWSDSDMIALRPIERTKPLLLVEERPKYLANGLLGIPAGHALARRLSAAAQNPRRPHPHDSWRTRVDKVKRIVRRDPAQPLGWTTLGPTLLSAVAEHMGLMDTAEPPDRYYPYLWHDPLDQPFVSPSAAFLAKVEQATTVHLWNYMLDRAGMPHDGPFAEDSLFEVWWRRFMPED